MHCLNADITQRTENALIHCGILFSLLALTVLFVLLPQTKGMQLNQ